MDKESYERDEGGFGQKNDLFIFFLSTIQVSLLFQVVAWKKGKRAWNWWKSRVGSKEFEDVDQILKVGKGEGFWCSIRRRTSIEALTETFQPTFLVSFSYISLSSNNPLF
jgi:hypothetical protein